MNENKYFGPAGDLGEFRNPVSEDKYFGPAGDLGEFRNPVSEDKYFRPAGDLGEFRNPVSEDKYFRPAGDIDSAKTKEEINDYLLTVVSGKKYPYESEMGKIVGAANTIVSLEEIKRMVSQGYNIVSAVCINSDMIIVEFQCFDKSNDIGRGR